MAGQLDHTEWYMSHTVYFLLANAGWLAYMRLGLEMDIVG